MRLAQYLAQPAKHLKDNLKDNLKDCKFQRKGMALIEELPLEKVT